MFRPHHKQAWRGHPFQGRGFATFVQVLGNVYSSISLLKVGYSRIADDLMQSVAPISIPACRLLYRLLETHQLIFVRNAIIGVLPGTKVSYAVELPVLLGNLSYISFIF